MKAMFNQLKHIEPLSKAAMKAIVGGSGKCLLLKDKCLSDVQCCSNKCAPVKKGSKEYTCQA